MGNKCTLSDCCNTASGRHRSGYTVVQFVITEIINTMVDTTLDVLETFYKMLIRVKGNTGDDTFLQLPPSPHKSLQSSIKFSEVLSPPRWMILRIRTSLLSGKAGRSLCNISTLMKRMLCFCGVTYHTRPIIKGLPVHYFNTVSV